MHLWAFRLSNYPCLLLPPCQIRRFISPSSYLSRKCSICGHTHALLLSVFVPYSQIPLPVQVEIISCYSENNSFSSIMENTPSIDENNIRYIIRQYLRHWKQRLLSENIPPKPPLSQFIQKCFAMWNRQFMEMKNMFNFIKKTKDIDSNTEEKNCCCGTSIDFTNNFKEESCGCVDETSTSKPADSGKNNCCGR